MTDPQQLQQIDRTYVRYRGRRLSYFSGCDYFRLASHPKVIAALAQGAKNYGISVAASRMTTGNHPLYSALEANLVRFFGVQSALLVSSGYMTNLVVAQALAGNFSHALIDERAHASLHDATYFLECPVLQFKHKNVEDLSRCLKRCGPGSKVILLTDGLFAHNGSVAPLKQYQEVLPADAVMLVDDAHGAGVLGNTGKGSLEYAGIGRRRVIQTITLSKAFGTYGGAILGSKLLRQKVLTRSVLFTGSTPIPLALAYAAQTAVTLLGCDSQFRKRLLRNSLSVKLGLRRVGLAIPETPAPIIGLAPPNEQAANKLKRVLLQAGIFPPLIVYPRTTANAYFRFAVSSEHTVEQLGPLQQALVKAGLAGWRGMG